MRYVLRILDRIARGARFRYRYYRYWKRQEAIARECTPERIEALQWQKFRRLFEFAYHRIPLYRDKFRQAGLTLDSMKRPEDIERIPVLTKDEIRQNFPDRMVDPARRYMRSQIGQTSGSTGESLHFVKPDEGWKYSILYSALLRTGGISNVPILVFSTPRCTPTSCSMADGRGVPDPPVGKFQRMRMFRHLDIEPIGLPPSENILAAPPEYMERVRRIVAFFSPSVMVVDPVYFGAFCRYLVHHGKPIPRLHALVTTYELLTPSLERLFRETFHCEVFTQYGASEISDVANECEHHRLHIRANNVIVEALRDGRPAGVGEPGKAVLTDLTNYNMPLIRYDIGDVIVRANGACPCGRNTATLERVLGRVCDLVKPAGAATPVTPFEVDSIFFGLSGVGAYRVVQRSQNLYRIATMPDGDGRSPDLPTMEAKGRALFGADSRFEFERVRTIAPERSMKFRFVHSDLPGIGL